MALSNSSFVVYACDNICLLNNGKANIRMVALSFHGISSRSKLVNILIYFTYPGLLRTGSTEKPAPSKIPPPELTFRYFPNTLQCPTSSSSWLKAYLPHIHICCNIESMSCFHKWWHKRTYALSLTDHLQFAVSNAVDCEWLLCISKASNVLSFKNHRQFCFNTCLNVYSLNHLWIVSNQN